MDELDRNILALLGADARMSVATLARRLKVARSTIQARLERLETSGVIAGYTLKLGEAARQGRLRASVLLTIEPRSQAGILSRLKAWPRSSGCLPPRGGLICCCRLQRQTPKCWTGCWIRSAG